MLPKDTVEGMIEKYGVSLISVGNGTACRESEQVIVDMLKEIPEKKGCSMLSQSEDRSICVFCKQTGYRGIPEL